MLEQRGPWRFFSLLQVRRLGLREKSNLPKSQASNSAPALEWGLPQCSRECWAKHMPAHKPWAGYCNVALGSCSVCWREHIPSADQASEEVLLSNLPPSLVWDQDDICLLWPLLPAPVFLWLLHVWEFKSCKHLENLVALLQSLSSCSPRFPLSILPTFSSP